MTEPKKDSQELADQELDAVAGGFLPNLNGLASAGAQGGTKGVLSPAEKAVKGVTDAVAGLNKPS